MPYKKEIEILNDFQWDSVSRGCCEIYWEVQRFYLCDEDKSKEILNENLEDLKLYT